MNDQQEPRIDAESAPAPRAVPWMIQCQLLDFPVVILIGAAFVVFSLGVFIIPQLLAGNRFESAWQFFPFIHLLVGLGMVIVPIIRWRHRVAILKWGQLAPARIVALQDQGSTRPVGGEGHGVRNLAGPWLDYETAFERARQFWQSTLPTAPTVGFNPMMLALNGFGCMLTSFMIFGFLFAVAGLAGIWLTRQPHTVTERSLHSLLLLGFMTVYITTAWLIRRWVRKVKRLVTGELDMRALGVKACVHCRIAFSPAPGRNIEATTYIDLRWRLERGQSQPLDTVAFLPDDVYEPLLLGGLWPPITIQDGHLVRQPLPKGGRTHG